MNAWKGVISMTRRNRAVMNLFYAPALLLFGVFVVFPLFEGIRISFTNWNGYLPNYKYVGFANYQRLFTDPYFPSVFWDTILYGFGCTLLQNVLGMGLALFMDTKFRGRGVLRAVVYLPAMIAPLIMGYVMFYVFQYTRGALNDIMLLFGSEAVDWLAAPNRTVTIILIVNTLQYVGVSMVLYLAGLQNIPAMYIEAAHIDGARPWNLFRYVTFPLLMPAITSSVILNLIGGLKLFDIIRALTPPSPSTGAASLSTYLTYQYANVERAGYSAVLGIVTFLFILIVSNLTMWFFDRKEAQML